MPLKSGPPAACAACKYQRRKCSSECTLAPYFPPDQPRQFQNAHRLFGVSNIIKILNRIPPHQKSDAMRSIIYESNIRDCCPVHGCLGVMFTLQFQLHQAQLELDAVNHALSLYRTGIGTCFGGVDLPVDVACAGGGQYSNIPFDAITTSAVTDIYNGEFSIRNAAAAAVMKEYDEISAYFDSIEEDQAWESSPETTPKENDLKNAAAYFSLTSTVVD